MSQHTERNFIPTPSDRHARARAAVQAGAVLVASGINKTVSSGSGELVILREIDFAVTRGEAVAIVGASGSGKSTLLSILAGLDTPTQGEVWLAGESLFTLSEDARAQLRGRRMGFVFQSFQLLPALTALENVMLPLELAGRVDAREAATQLLERVGLRERLHHQPRHLSGGEQQRVALARAFVMQPQLVLADEPTGSLDARAGAEIIDLMFEMNAQQQTTLVLVTHDPVLAQRCQRVLRLQAGEWVNAAPEG